MKTLERVLLGTIAVSATLGAICFIAALGINVYVAWLAI